MKKPSVLILSSSGGSLPIAYNYLIPHFVIDQVVIEESVSKKQLLKYRFKKLGLFKVIGQVQFMLLSKLLSKQASARRQQIFEEYNLSDQTIPAQKISRVKSVNTKACRKILRQSKSDFILVNGTRIIGKKTLASTTKKFVNIHAGITPKYRGVHGGYWALASDDKENCGVTLHYVDAGVDTGDIIAQAIIHPTTKDTFITYPILQQKAGLDLLLNNSDFILAGRKGSERSDLESHQWFHPTFFGYLFKRLTKGVK